MIRKVVFCANRMDKGGSGGAIGVMALLKELLDIDECIPQIEYLYRKGNLREFIIDVLKAGGLRKGVYYFCHEPESAALLSILRRSYSLVYHQQGPYVAEYIGREKKPSKLRIRKKALYEKLAFRGADTVYFPSEGAKDTFFMNKYCTVKETEVNIGPPLFNTINPNEEVVPLNDIKEDNNYITFLSIGTMTKAKGQDLAFSFIKSYVECSTKPVRWITVGDGILKQNIIEECRKLMDTNDSFKHIHYDKIPHGSVLYLDAIADIYIMFHRMSIFDLSTLEAMNKRCAIVLSNVGGNRDFNKDSNCILVDYSNIRDGLKKLIESDIETLKKRNALVFDKYFSPACFRERYTEVINKTCKRGQNS